MRTLRSNLNRNYRQALIYVSLIAFSLLFRQAQSAELRERPPFESQVIAIDQLLGMPQDRISSMAMRGFEPFDKLAGCASQNIDAAIDFLAKPDASWRQKKIAALGMYKLSSSDFVLFLSRAIRLYNDRKINSRELFEIILPGQALSNVAISSFDDPELRPVLFALRARSDLDEHFRSMLSQLLSGQIYASWRDSLLIDAPQPLPFDPRTNAFPINDKRWRPAVPSQFPRFALLFKGGFATDLAGAPIWIADVLHEGQREIDQPVREFLERGLASDADDAEWLRLWRIWNPNFEAPPGMAMRAFVGAVRDELARPR